VIDLHTHVLPGIDDGAHDLAQSIEIARAAVGAGVRCLAATPHVRDDYRTTPDAIHHGVAELRATLAAEGIELDVLPGAEIALDRLDDLDEAELRRLGLAGNERLLLIETPYYGWPLRLPQQLFDLQLAGFTPVLAHPERNAEIHRDPTRLEELVRNGVLVQLTAGSLAGTYGRPSQVAGHELLDLGLAHLAASDWHGWPSPGLDAVARAVGDEALSRWLTTDVPSALVRGDELPPRPERRPRWSLRRR
jgi:protein-tyrosine phosphatase